MASKIIDVAWQSKLGFGQRPWIPSDHLTDLVISDIEVRNVANDKGFYFPVASGAKYLRGKRSEGAVIDTAAYPNGYWYKSVLLRNISVDGVKRIDNDKIQGAHTDGLYITDAPEDGTSKVDFTIDGYKLRNTDGSCMAILLQGPGRYGTFTLRGIDWDDTVAQRRLVLKTDVQIDLLRLENTNSMFTVNPPDGNGFVKRIEVKNCPNVNLKGFTASTEIVQVTDPVPVPPAPGPLPEKKLVSIDLLFSDGSKVTVPVP